MSAVTTKPRSRKVAPAPLVYRRPEQVYVPNTDSTPAQRLATLQAALAEADEKLEMAYDAAEVGQPIDLVLEYLAHDLIPDAVRPMRSETPTAVDAEATYNAMFMPLALLESAMALSLGTIVHGALVEAFLLLDWAQTECDSVNLTSTLPAAAPECTDVPTTQSPERMGTCPDFISEAWFRSSEASEVLRLSLTELDSGAAYGAHVLMDLAREYLSELASIEGAGLDDCNTASEKLNVAINVLDLILDSPECLAADGALTLLRLSKTILDDGIGSHPWK